MKVPVVSVARSEPSFAVVPARPVMVVAAPAVEPTAYRVLAPVPKVAQGPRMPLVFTVVVVTVPLPETFNVLSPVPVREMGLKFRVILAD